MALYFGNQSVSLTSVNSGAEVKYHLVLPLQQSGSNINKNLIINSAVLKATQIVSGKNAMLTAKVSGDAASIVVLDADGNAVEFKKVASNEKNGIVTFQAVWTVTGNRGDVFNYVIICYDESGRRSANTKTVTATIK